MVFVHSATSHASRELSKLMHDVVVYSNSCCSLTHFLSLSLPLSLCLSLSPFLAVQSILSCSIIVVERFLGSEREREKTTSYSHALYHTAAARACENKYLECESAFFFVFSNSLSFSHSLSHTHFLSLSLSLQVDRILSKETCLRLFLLLTTQQSQSKGSPPPLSMCLVHLIALLSFSPSPTFPLFKLSGLLHATRGI